MKSFPTRVSEQPDPPSTDTNSRETWPKFERWSISANVKQYSGWRMYFQICVLCKNRSITSDPISVIFYEKETKETFTRAYKQPIEYHSAGLVSRPIYVYIYETGYRRKFFEGETVSRKRRDVGNRFKCCKYRYSIELFRYDVQGAQCIRKFKSSILDAVSGHRSIFITNKAVCKKQLPR